MKAWQRIQTIMYQKLIGWLRRRVRYVNRPELSMTHTQIRMPIVQYLAHLAGCSFFTVNELLVKVAKSLLGGASASA